MLSRIFLNLTIPNLPAMAYYKRPLILLAFGLLQVFSLMAQIEKVRIKTESGDILLELYANKAPITVSNFLKYVDQKIYNGISFYRVVRMNNQPDKKVKIEVIQGGLGADSLKRLPAIAQETTNKTGIKHLSGVVSMARGAPESGSSEFFICINNQPELDFGGHRNPDGQGFAAFGKVTKGMDVVRKIQSGATGEKEKIQALVHPVKIITVERIK